MNKKCFKEMLNEKFTVGCSHDNGEEYNINRSLNDFIITLENELEYAPLDEIEHQNLLEFIVELKRRLDIEEESDSKWRRSLRKNETTKRSGKGLGQ